MKILQITPRFSFPEDDGGKISIANIFKQFSLQNAEATLFSLNCERIPDEAVSEAKRYGNVILFDHNTKNTPIKIAKSIFANTSIYIEKHINKKILDCIDKLINIHNYDVIHADHTCMGPIALHFQNKYNIPFGLRLHNVEYKIWQRYIDEIKNPIKKLYIANQAKLLKNKEAELISQANVNFAITENDRQGALQIAPRANIITASAGVDLAVWQPSDFKQRNPNHLVLATTFNWVHNVNALRWFLENILPALFEKNPQTKMFIIGKNPPEWIENSHSIGAVPLGYLSDIKPVIQKCGIYVAPLFVGSGIRIKILEAMAMELPVVATSISAEGINATENEGLFIENSKDGYVDTILKLMNNNDLRINSGKSARNFIQQNFNWSTNVQKMLHAYSQIIKNNS